MSGTGHAAGRVHVVGAGLAGLAAALALSRAGHAVTVHEAAGHAGGRCRSYRDPVLGRQLDNGNHLLLSGNTDALGYLAEIGAAGSLTGPEAAVFPFLDLRSGLQWALRPGRTAFPWWILDRERRVPGSRPLDYLRALRLARAGAGATVSEAVGAGPLMERLWRPLTVAALNAEPEEASATLLAAALRETLARGGRHCRPLVARDGLDDSFVRPAVATLANRGVRVEPGRRLRGLELAGDRTVGLRFGDGDLALGPRDGVVLAVPADAAAALLPGLPVPEGSAAIVNAHYLVDPSAGLLGGLPFLGLLGGLAQWVFLRGAVASVTVSAADGILDETAEALLERLWPDVAAAMGQPGLPRPAGRIVKERRATFRQTPHAALRRPPARTAWRNLVLAGDWTATGLPATIEGAVRSGRAAAALLAAG